MIAASKKIHNPSFPEFISPENLPQRAFLDISFSPVYKRKRAGQNSIARTQREGGTTMKKFPALPIIIEENTRKTTKEG